jgi:molybdenum cofactor cytidylyltransferase
MKIACVVMASGNSKRFGQDKLMYPLDGIPICGRLLGALPKKAFTKVIVVAKDKRVKDLAADMGCAPVHNNDTEDDAAVTIRYGIGALPPETDGCLFCVADQPWLSGKSALRIIERFESDPSRIYALSWKGEAGNPVLFPRCLFVSLSTLEKGTSGRAVIARNRCLLTLVEAGEARELWI